MQIYITEPNETHPDAIKLLKQNSHTIITDIKKHKPNDIQVLFVRTYTQADKQYLSQFPNLKYILRIGVGLDNIDVDECKKRNITVINAPGSNANSVAEFVIGVTIVGLRNLFPQSNRLKSGHWRDKQYIGSEIKNKTIGFIGCGAIAKLIAKKLQSFEIQKIIGYDPYLNADALVPHNIIKTELIDIIQNADIISLHLPLTSETKNLIAMKQLMQMKPPAILINTSRGGIVNETDLIEALKNKTIKAAALDVFEHEPDVRKELLKLDNLITTPHIAGYTEEADREMAINPVKQFLQTT